MGEKKSVDMTLENNERFVNRVKSRMRLKTAVLLFIIALLAITTATLAWFTLNSFSSVNNMEMTIGTGAELLVSTVNNGTDLTKYGKEITNEMINSHLREYNTNLNSMRLDPVTSSNGTAFYSQFNEKRTENVGGFLEFDIYFIATKDIWVHLSSDETETNAADGTRVNTNSTGSMAEVVRAVRMSFTDAGNSTRIYEPNKASAVASQVTFDLPSPMRYSNDTRLFQLKEMEPTKVTVRLWIEGEDPQCNNDIQNAHLAVQLCFKGTDENNESIG